MNNISLFLNLMTLGVGVGGEVRWESAYVRDKVRQWREGMVIELMCVIYKAP